MTIRDYGQQTILCRDHQTGYQARVAYTHTANAHAPQQNPVWNTPVALEPTERRAD